MGDGDERRSNRWAALAGFLAATFLASAIGSWFTASSVGTWYPQLEKPGFTPPSWVFGPVWTALYILMAVAAWLVWRRVGFAGGRSALTLYGVQLVLNAAWSGLFFGLRNPALGFACIVLLWIAIVATAVLFWRIRTAAGLLFVPYILWVTYAGALNVAIWRLNA